MIDHLYILGVIAGMAVITLALRALPFVAAQWLKQHPLIERLGEFLPLAIMTLLLVHSAADAAKSHQHGPWPELMAIALVVALQWRSKNALLSIVLGTGLYVLLRNSW